MKGDLGANAILAVSIAACKAGAAEKDVPFHLSFILFFSPTIRCLIFFDLIILIHTLLSCSLGSTL